MADWKSFKGQTPWTAEHVDKPSYNEGDHLADYSDPVWLMTEGNNTPVTPTHKPCGYWTRDYVPPPYIPPQVGALIGWYKFDEGSGAVVKNYAAGGGAGGGLLPDLTVFNTYAGLFWTYLSGFGSTPQIYFGGGTGADFAWSEPNRTLGGANKATIGIFLRSIPDAAASRGGYAKTGQSLINGGIGSRIASSLPGGGGWMWQWNLYNLSFTYDVTLTNAWLFQFIDSDGYYRIVKPDGTILKSASAANLTFNLPYTYAFAGVGLIDADPPTIGYYPGGVSYGDWIIYNSMTLTLTEWAEWYDQLRSRYGMAARSGW